ncbi:peroxidase 44-like, partial [Trifolium medium]|nr:peroxidase 44-like [Trifolium medium]
MKLFMMIILPVILFCCVFPLALALDLQVGFYSTSCGKAESIVQKLVEKRFSQDKSITAALLRMHFHDCFVR